MFPPTRLEAQIHYFCHIVRVVESRVLLSLDGDFSQVHVGHFVPRVYGAPVRAIKSVHKPLKGDFEAVVGLLRPHQAVQYFLCLIMDMARRGIINQYIESGVREVRERALYATEELIQISLGQALARSEAWAIPDGDVGIFPCDAHTQALPKRSQNGSR